MKITEPCSFRILQIPVTDDAAIIDAAYKQMVSKNKHLENDTQRGNVEIYKRIISAGVQLRTRPKEAVDFHTTRFSDFVTNFIRALKGDVPQETYDFFLTHGQAPELDYHLAPHLAKSVIDGVLDKYGCKVGGQPVRTPPAPPSPPTLVVGLIVSTENGYTHLAWKRPDNGCDRVRVIAKHEGFPSNENDGREVFAGLADDCVDGEASPGRVCHYAVFSYSGGVGSSPASTKGKHFLAAGVKQLKCSGLPLKIEICWENPSVEFQRIVVFRAPAGALGIEYKSGQFPVAKPGTSTKTLGKGTNLIERCGEGEVDGVTPGTLYEYMVVVDYGPVDSNREFSPGQTIACAAIEAAEPVRDPILVSNEKGIRVSWTRSRQLCERVVVVRSSDHYPVTEKDGQEIALDCDVSCLDTGLKAGTTYYYSIFSVYLGHASGVIRASKLYAGAPTDFRVTDPVANPGAISLNWTQPANSTALRLFRGKGGAPKTSLVAGRLNIELNEEQDLTGDACSAFSQTVETGVTYYYHLHALYSDGQWSSAAVASGLALAPALRVRAPRASVSSAGDVNLTWLSPEPDKARTYRYRVWRRQLFGAGEAGSQLLGEVGETLFRDGIARRASDAPVPGRSYGYAIESLVGAVSAPAVDWVDVCVTRDVELKSALGLHGAVVLDWSPPVNAKRTEVTRNQGGMIVSSDHQRATDLAVTDGTSYGYTITAIFVDPAGKEFRAGGVAVSVTPVVPAKPLCNATVAWEGGVTISWLIPSSPIDGVIVARLDNPPTCKVGDFLDASRIEPLATVESKDTRFKDTAARIGQIWFYALYTVRAATATYSGYVGAPLLAPVGSLTATNRESTVGLQWQWPHGVEAVSICRRVQCHSKHLERRSVCTRGQYVANSFYADTIPSDPACYTYELRSVSVGGGTAVESLLSAEIEVVGGKLPKVTYKIDKKRSGVEAVLDLRGARAAQSTFGELVFVRNSSRDPRSSDDGEVVARWSPNSGNLPDKTVVLVDSKPPSHGRVYYRVFLCGTDTGKQMVALISPSVKERNVEFH